MNVRSTAGALTGSLVADVSAPGQSVAGDLSVRHLDLAPLLKNPAQKSDITGTVHVDLHGDTLSDLNSLRGSVHVDAPRIAAAGLTIDQVKGDAQIQGAGSISTAGRAPSVPWPRRPAG